jgi:hypothetical protein
VYPVELGICLKQIVYPVHKLYDDAFEICPDSRLCLEEFTVSTVLLRCVTTHHLVMQ